MPSVEGSPDEPAVARFGVRAADAVDLFAYTVVLGLFAGILACFGRGVWASYGLGPTSRELHPNILLAP
ncbi:hypothetical protein [Planctomonas sp. JC2975]|uniref:hypothetical protein n=1 Tax=Planctomonas sp. JC2975 TaxID=2729626 RepID=UPI00147667B1|nr:hypothetical protein [Planctomonas sp. JC2975]